MDEAEQLITGYFHLIRSARRKQRAETESDRLFMLKMKAIHENERRRALRQARLEWAEDRDAWEKQWP